MESVRLLCFPVQSVTDPFKLEPVGNMTPIFEFKRSTVDWSSNNLSGMLNKQVKNNYIDLNQLSGMCEYPPGYEQALYITDYTDDIFRIVTDYYTTSEKKTVQCEKFFKQFTGHVDVLERDQEVFNQTDWNVTTYAIVLLYKGEYFGHIYTWLSPIDSTTCFAMGIRGRVDSVFRTDKLQNVASYLLEGVRRFALAKGARSIIITHPLDVMRVILLRLGFTMTLSENKSHIGKSLGGENKHFHGLNTCMNCCKYRDLSVYFAANVAFTLLE